MKKFFYYAIAFPILAVISCHKAPDQRQEVLALRQMGNLATTEYVVTKIVKANDDQTWYKLGDRKILISCQANIKAGVDLTKLTADDVAIDGKNITLYMPPPQVLSLSVPPEKIKVEYKEISMLRNDFDNAERDALLTQAENQIRNSVKELGVIETAEKNTTLFVTDFLKKLGFESVTISYDKRPEINIHHD
jgi:hypothetical protein